jgi:hypothetical protein
LTKPRLIPRGARSELGLLLAVIVMEANCPEQLGSAAVVMEAEDAIENLVIIWVDQGLTVQTSVG